MTDTQSLTATSTKSAKKRSRRSKNYRDQSAIDLGAENVHVRVAKPDDANGILELARLVNEENGIFPMDLDKVHKLMMPSLYKEGGIVGVIGEKDKLEAGILLRISSLWYADKPFLEEMSLFVHPDYRSARGGRASKLIEFAKKCATELDMPLMIGVLSNDRTSAKVRMYEKRLGDPVGAFFLWGAKTGQDVIDEEE